MLAAPLSELRRRAESFAEMLRSLHGFQVTVRDETAFAGGGSLPDTALPTCVVALRADGLSEKELAERLRSGSPPVVSRVHAGEVLIDLRTVFESQECELIEALSRSVSAK
ncbi:MAG: hypothetical protein U0791_24670, partial [Gemmataceae bacterium]